MMFRRRRTETYEQMHRRLIRETEIGLLIGLHFPERMPRIPTREVGKGGFEPGLAESFWGDVLGDTSELARLARELGKG